MSQVKVKYSNLRSENEHNREGSSWLIEGHEVDDGRNEVEDFIEDPQMFLLNNILMSVQFFENYERDVEKVREKWFKEENLKKHKKKCFHADAIFRLMGNHVKFKPRHGSHKNIESSLHPLRIFISDDNVQVSYDPSNLPKVKIQHRPNYQLTVKPCENNKKDKSGYISLVEFKTTDESNNNQEINNTVSNQPHHPSNIPGERSSTAVYLRRTGSFESKTSRNLTKTEKLIGLQSKNLNSRRNSTRSFGATNEFTIPSNAFYDYTPYKERIKPKSVHEYRMDDFLEDSHHIPRRCFQTEEVKKALSNRKKSAMKRSAGNYFTTRNFLNAAAFKAHFCNVLIEKLPKCLNLQLEALDVAKVHEEYVVVNQQDNTYQITPVVRIRDWNNHLNVEKKVQSKQILQWPTTQMNQILRILPCFAAPVGYSTQFEENVDYEKEWKLVFPKSEEFLLLHMMHAHIRCYFFALAVCKSFIESEINTASFSPKHLLHLLFWRVHANFTAWPEDRPGEVLINFFKILYKKLQNKSLCDFFIPHRNLFTNSLTKDLHKVQTILKKILENPVMYILRTVSNLKQHPEFYPVFDVAKFNCILTGKQSEPEINPKSKKRERRTVRFEDDEERHWKKEVIRQINLEKKMEQHEMARKLSVDSIVSEEVPQLDFAKSRKVLEMFISHFIDMGLKSAEYEALNQALIYLDQSQKLLELLPGRKIIDAWVRATKEKIEKLQEKCEKLKSRQTVEKNEKIEKEIKENRKTNESMTIKIVNESKNNDPSDDNNNNEEEEEKEKDYDENINEEFETKL